MRQVKALVLLAALALAACEGRGLVIDNGNLTAPPVCSFGMVWNEVTGDCEFPDGSRGNPGDTP